MNAFVFCAGIIDNSTELDCDIISGVVQSWVKASQHIKRTPGDSEWCGNVRMHEQEEK